MTSPEEKDRRRRRMKRNRIAHDLHSSKYRQRRVDRKRKPQPEEAETWNDDDLFDVDTFDDDNSSSSSSVGGKENG